MEEFFFQLWKCFFSSSEKMTEFVVYVIIILMTTEAPIMLSHIDTILRMFFITRMHSLP
jgi:hypothetical protein